jgi:hypothetical protein
MKMCWLHNKLLALCKDFLRIECLTYCVNSETRARSNG